MNEWIDIDEEEPPHDELILAVDKFTGFVSLARFDSNTRLVHYMYMGEMDPDSEVTHWIKIPEFIKVES